MHIISENQEPVLLDLF